MHRHFLDPVHAPDDVPGGDEQGGDDQLLYCVGIGTDFDGIGGNLEVGEPGQLTLLFEALEKAGITPRQIDKIASGNVLRVMKETMRPRFE